MKWETARRQIRRQYNEFRREKFKDCHPAHAAEWAFKEWWNDGYNSHLKAYCDPENTKVILYFDVFGDIDAETICFLSWRERFFIASFGDMYRRYKARFDLGPLVSKWTGYENPA